MLDDLDWHDPGQVYVYPDLDYDLGQRMCRDLVMNFAPVHGLVLRDHVVQVHGKQELFELGLKDHAVQGHDKRELIVGPELIWLGLKHVHHHH